MFLGAFTPASRSSAALAPSFERLFDETFDRLPGHGGGGEAAQRSPALNLAQTGRGYSVKLEFDGEQTAHTGSQSIDKNPRSP